MICCSTVRYVMLCRVVSCCVMTCHDIISYVISCHDVICYAVLWAVRADFLYGYFSVVYVLNSGVPGAGN